MEVPLFGSVAAQQPGALGEIAIAGDQQAGVPECPQVFGRIEAKRPEGTDRPGLPAFVGRAQSLRRVLDYGQSMLGGPWRLGRSFERRRPGR